MGTNITYPKILDDIAHHRSIVETSIQKIDNAINTIESTKVPLNTKIDSKPEILLIVDKGMSRITEGPTLNKDEKGKAQKLVRLMFQYVTSRDPLSAKFVIAK